MSEKSDSRTIKYILGFVGVCLIIMVATLIFKDDKSEKYSNEQYVDTRDLVPKVNDTIKVGSFDVTVTKVARSGDNVVLSVTAKNMSDKAETLFSDGFKIRDDDGNEYSCDLSIAFANVNPGIEKTGDLNFEIPAKAENLTAAVRAVGVDFADSDKFQTISLEQ